MSTPTILVDANVFFAATKSPNGGSALILLLAKSGKIKVITVKQALFEAEQNILKKLGTKYLDTYYRILLEASPKIQPISAVKFQEIMLLSKILPLKDVPIFLGALYSKSEFLVTLDKKHFLENAELKSAFPEVKIVNPEKFLKFYLKI